MADKPIWGAPPQPGDFVEGALFLYLYIPDGGDAGDGTPITVQCNAYAYQPPNAIDWGDGTWEDALAFTEDYPPSGGAPGLWTAEHDYKANGNIHRGYVETAVRAHFNVMVGHARIIDPEDRDKNQNELYAEARADMREARDQQRVRVGRVN